MSVLATSRLLLRPFAMTDVPSLARLYGDGVIMRYIGDGASLKPQEALTRARANIVNFNAHWADRGYGVWAITDRVSGRLLGRCGLRDVAEVNGVELLYLLNKTAWGRGLASEAAAAAVDYGFRVAGLPQIFAFTHQANLASQRVLQKIGFAFDKIAPLWGRDGIAWHSVTPVQVSMLAKAAGDD